MATMSMTDKLKQFVAQAIDQHADDSETVSWDIGSGMGPNNQLFHFLTLVMPSPSWATCSWPEASSVVLTISTRTRSTPWSLRL